jgi:hypothetical protein
VDGDGGRDAVADLAAWLGEAVARAGLTHRALAARIYQHPSGVTKALSGSASPPSWPLTQAIAHACHADLQTARRLWAAAHQAAVMRTRRVADGWPPDDLAHHDDLCRALWWRLAAPEIEGRRKTRLDGLRASQGGTLIWMGRWSW